MSCKRLRLCVDSPYPGESMSSFLGRTAQFYGSPASVLVRELMAGQRWSGYGRRDIDLLPPAVLERRLSGSVRDWRSPLQDHHGFRGWALAPRRRVAYCPRCFEDDLASGLTPYFRNDWIPVLVTTCWVHQTPLFDWITSDEAGFRRLPKAWLYKTDLRMEAAPAFVQAHLAALHRLRDADASLSGINLQDLLTILWKLQQTVEKRSKDAPISRADASPIEGDLRFYARGLVEAAARYTKGHREGPLGELGWPEAWPEWFGPLPFSTRRREWEYSDHGLRQTSCIKWRRSYLSFAGRTLAGTERFKSLLAGGGEVLPWRLWWQRLAALAGPEQRESLDWCRRSMMRGIDGRDMPPIAVLAAA